MHFGVNNTISLFRKKMWSVVALCLVAVVTIFITHWVHNWRNPKCSNGVLPPGSMGLPIIGETLHLLIPSRSLDLHPFIKKRIQRYGPLFRTSLAGRPVIISTDPEVNNYIFSQEGKSVEVWYLDTFAKVFNMDGESKTTGFGAVHRYIRSTVLNHFGTDSLKGKLLPQIEQMIQTTLRSWSTQESIELKDAVGTMAFDWTAKHIIGYDPTTSPDKLSENFANILQGLMSFPLNIPGTAFHKCLKAQKKIINMIRNKLKEKRGAPERSEGDLLDQAVRDMSSEKFLTEEFVVYFIFGLLFASFESLSSVITVALKLLSENPEVLNELRAEHEAILKKRDNSDSTLTWDEYKSMPFTLQVINESLRLANISPGFLRRATKDVQVNGRELDSSVISKNFTPFGGGMRQCAGADFTRAFMASLFHVLVIKYRWTKIKGGDVISRTPMLDFGDGIYIKVTENA
ncbi:hypothetical protein RHMOL_Rhmol02G0262600 [Rhododendron molle]|uniref:Uncharacterized protein n=1 Tax=Rhododendron molle TaxID=49168 RepID=A0ACC0PW56_RHOML|nr:hypothetical protein RHMOL_Rhmol02G0262600 [Rhododendron molle]